MAHLSHDQFAALLAHTGGQVESDHLQACPECRAELQDFASSLRSWAASCHTHAEHSADFWYRQSTSVFRRAHARQARRLWAPVAAAATLLIAAALALTGFSPHQPMSPVSAEDTSNDAVLLQQIEDRLSSDVPDALAPATLLTDDMSAHMQSSSRVPKEKSNEM